MYSIYVTYPSQKCEMGLFKKVTTHKLCQNANFEIVEHLAISLLSRVHDTFGYFEMQKEYSCHFTY